MSVSISIITVTYNAADVLAVTLKSIANQKLRNFEHLIIDGASKDDTLKIAGTFEKDIPEMKIFSERDKGLYDAMNKGISLAKGQLLWFMNAGDEIAHADATADIQKALEGGADVIYSDTLMLNEDRSPFGLRTVVTPHQLPSVLKWTDFKLGMKVCHQSFLAKRAMAKPYIDQNLSADIDWEIAILKKSTKATFLDKPLAKYLRGGVSMQKQNQSWKDRFYVQVKHFGYIPTVFYTVAILIRGLFFAIKTKSRYWQ